MKYFSLLIFISFVFISGCTDTITLKRLSSPASCSLPSGVLDTTFGTSGAIEIDNPLAYGTSNRTDVVNSIITDSSGSIYATGKTDNELGTEFNLFISKYNASGTVDTGFGGGDGYAEKSLTIASTVGESGNDIKLLSTGEIVTVGGLGNGTTLDFGISIWNTTGTSDTSVQFDGVANSIDSCDTGAPSNDDEANAVAIDSSNNLFVTGYCLDDGGNENLLVMKTNSSGVLDTSFSNAVTQGIYNFGTNTDGTKEVGNDIFLDSNGNPIIIGTRLNNSSSTTLVIKLTKDTGVPDTTFGGGDGVIDDGVNGQLNQGAIDSSGNIYAVGRSHNGSNWDMSIWRFTSSGVLDSSWGTSGKVLFNLGDDENAFDLKIDSCGNLVVFGLIKDTGSARTNSAIWRYTSTGSLDTSFGSGAGYVTNSLETASHDKASSGLITNANKYLTGGTLRENTTANQACNDSNFCNLYFLLFE